jgi:hypothetical protein
VEIDRIVGDAPGRIVFAKDVLGGLLVVVVNFAAVGFCLFAQLFGAGSVAVLVCFLRLRRERLLLAELMAGEIAKAVVCGLGV